MCKYLIEIGMKLGVHFKYDMHICNKFDCYHCDEYGYDEIFIKRPLILAIENNSKEICELLLENGVNINPDSGFTKISSLLSHSILKGNKEICEFLISKGAWIMDDYGKNALIKTIQLDRKEICKLLISKGVDVNIKTKNGKSGIMLCINSEYNTYIERFNIKETEKKGKEICELLLDAGASITKDELRLLDKNGWKSCVKKGILNYRKGVMNRRKHILEVYRERWY
jgi:ankyrin repeat protein